LKTGVLGATVSIVNASGFEAPRFPAASLTLAEIVCKPSASAALV